MTENDNVLQTEVTQSEANKMLLIIGQKEWLNPREVNMTYGLSVSTLAKWRMGRVNLSFSKMGKYIKYKRSDIEAFIESNKIEVA